MGIDKSKYGKLVKDVKLVTVLLKSIELIDVTFPEGEGIKYDVKMDYGCEEFKKISEIVEFYPKFNLRVEYQDESLVELKFELRAVYEFDSIEDYEDEYILKFIELNVPVNIWPYAREIISSITTRVGYPALILPPYKA
ncbi:TPA: protein-export chaperone SecB [Clostridioides difficile]|uniref:protein-export chaperone SecB n=1 Tax=unclassified Clostridioides TaxID=2635829 RepID=UPI001C190F54|nr:protein-export chaperone SecB [Clostridioides difficile]MCC0630169.1 protein-export chaperone SecB [Clostridioides sp. ES-S-0171-01]MCC0689607.1 protein-export chaperone SecB [Clostridioides sp. ES-S-0056-01]MCC0715335.1 protein-export chaperone SecB [Clostridioides sp. ES-S-0077-01]MCC0783362.1 protein-export chaperone SecB [Clostridioides sp. ES-S-0108-01]UDN52223.1 protein-export chaperone SecB [Clostridioides sp. ES-S-0107-01]